MQQIKKDFERIGVKAMQLEPCLWGVYDVQDGRQTLVGVILVHVDDFLFTASPRFDINILTSLFSWGSYSYLPTPLTFLKPSDRTYWTG